MTGASADAIDAVFAMSNPHPSIRAQVIVFASSTAWETFYVGGAYREACVCYSPPLPLALVLPPLKRATPTPLSLTPFAGSSTAGFAAQCPTRRKP